MLPNVPHHFERRPSDYPRRIPPKYGWRDDNGKPIHAIDEHGNPICGRTKSPSKEPCQNKDRSLCSNGRCAVAGHGGRSPGAPLKTGRYSMFLPTRLAATYEEVTNDDVLNNVRENIAVLVTMIQEKLADLGEDSSSEQWKEAQAIYSLAKQAIIERDEAALFAHLDELGKLFNSGSASKQKESELIELMRVSGRLTRVEITRIEKMGQFMTANQMLANQATILAVIKKHVDPSVLSKIAHELGLAAHAKYIPH